ncbi:MAG: NAD(P)-binding protein [Acidimicrobiia bacterium]|nr:FAD-dependent oxidoreductase [bacterium]MXX63533.1 NAD(P)-binding protein [Acidimicrobiia bacterium]MXZ06885.1 NAD(P)-binding protein [Acidimicrobiia bacterium]MYF26484.1 NAD(P)-binding protein [Acidimicrobiia bacterium]
MRVSVPGVGQPDSRVDLTFEGRPVKGWAGDTLAAALIAAGESGLRETFDGGRRGVFCGMGACHECSVVVDGRPGKLACMTGVDSGSVVEPQPALSPAPQPPRGERPKQEIAPTVLVVGGGPAGLSAAAVIAESGVDVTLIDERSKPGGQFYKQPSPERPIDEHRLDKQFRAGRNLIERAQKAGVRFLNNITIWGAFAPDRLTAQGAGYDWVLRPSRLILATGAYERSVPIPGWTLPGVMMTGAAQTLLRSGSVSPGRRVMLSGNGPLNMQVAAELVGAGVEVVALAEQADLRWWRNLGAGAGMFANAPELVAKGFSYRTTLTRAGVPVLDRSSVIEIRGEKQVEEVVTARLDDSGHPRAGTDREFQVDAVCLGYGFVPANEISRALGCDHRVDQETGNLVTVRSPTGRTSINTVWVVGDAGRISGAYTAAALGILAGAEVVDDLGLGSSESLAEQVSRSRRSLRRHRRFQDHLRSLYQTKPLTTQLARDSTLVCRCESVPLGELRQAFGGGAATAGAVKRLTRAGMGMCQGRYCSPSVLALAAESAETPLGEYSGFAPQTPLRPMAIADLIGDDL